MPEEVLDDLKTPSITKTTEPMFQFKNVFRPTSRNMIILGTLLKASAATLIATGTAVLMIDLSMGIKMIIGSLLGGFIGEGIILFSKEEPLSTLIRAAEDIKIEAVVNQVPPNQPIEQVSQ